MEQPFARINELVAGRTVAVVCQGPSAPFVKEVGRKDWCYASVNRARLVEDLCPSPLEMVYCVSELRLDQEAEWLEKFPGMVISAATGASRLKRDFLQLPEGKGPGLGPINTTAAFLYLLMMSDVQDILLFGCDGTGKTYYRVEEYPRKELNGSVLDDSNDMNRDFWRMARRAAPNWKGSIAVVGPRPDFSQLTCFPTLTGEDMAKVREMKAMDSTTLPPAMKVTDVKTREQIPDFLRAHFPEGTGVELGVHRGEYSEVLLKGSLGLLYSVDRWAGDRGHNMVEYHHALRRLNKFGERSVVLKASFDEALPLFQDAYFDFVYIDGYAHTGQESGKTLRDWWAKVRPGGLFAGHDYAREFPLTIKEVDAFAKSVSGSLHITTEAKYPSWLMLK